MAGPSGTEFKSILMAEILPLYALSVQKWYYTWTSKEVMAKEIGEILRQKHTEAPLPPNEGGTGDGPGRWGGTGGWCCDLVDGGLSKGNKNPKVNNYTKRSVILFS